MLPLWLSTFLMAVLALNFAVNIPKQAAAQTALTAEVTATRILAYRQALKNYLVDHPSSNDSINDDDLAAYWPTGCAKLTKKTDPDIRNIVENGYPYVYTTSTLPSGTLTALWKKRRPFPVGNKVDSGPSNALRSPDGTLSTITLPSGITGGALVIVM